MKDILHQILVSILPLEENETVSVEEEELEDGTILLKTYIPKDKMGIVIGKMGKTINSIKNILKIKAIKENKRIEIEVIEQA